MSTCYKRYIIDLPVISVASPTILLLYILYVKDIRIYICIVDISANMMCCAHHSSQHQQLNHVIIYFIITENIYKLYLAYSTAEQLHRLVSITRREKRKWRENPAADKQTQQTQLLVRDTV